jgi:hypothetical protein
VRVKDANSYPHGLRIGLVVERNELASHVPEDLRVVVVGVDATGIRVDPREVPCVHLAEVLNVEKWGTGEWSALVGGSATRTAGTYAGRGGCEGVAFALREGECLAPGRCLAQLET